jgi:TPP-dependent pyruvate/acetoin dehydrogenase alpha subunit
MPLQNIYIPKNKKIINHKNISTSIISDFERKIYDLYNKGKIKYPIHLTKGNEKQLIQIFKYINKNDWVFSSWRNHAHALLHNIPEKKLIDQIFKGKSMYISSKTNNFFCSSIAGGVIPIALGVALAIKKKRKKQKVWIFVGDMTSFMGVFYEAYNYSRNLKLPLEFVIEDNEKSVYSDTKKVWGVKKFKYPKDVFYYKFKLGYPHHGTGKWVSF